MRLERGVDEFCEQVVLKNSGKIFFFSDSIEDFFFFFFVSLRCLENQAIRSVSFILCSISFLVLSSIFGGVGWSFFFVIFAAEIFAALEKNVHRVRKKTFCAAKKTKKKLVNTEKNQTTKIVSLCTEEQAVQQANSVGKGFSSFSELRGFAHFYIKKSFFFLINFSTKKKEKMEPLLTECERNPFKIRLKLFVFFICSKPQNRELNRHRFQKRRETHKIWIWSTNHWTFSSNHQKGRIFQCRANHVEFLRAVALFGHVIQRHVQKWIQIQKN